MISPQIIPTMKKKVALEMHEISVVVNTLLLVVHLISGVTKAKLIKVGVHVHTNIVILIYLDLMEFHHQFHLNHRGHWDLAAKFHSDAVTGLCNCSLSSGFTDLELPSWHTTITRRLLFE